MINNVTIVGRLTKDPEMRYTPSGVAFCRFSLAVNRRFANQNGDRDADFINCVAWKKSAENLANYQRRGNLIGVEGRIQTGRYKDQSNEWVYTTEVIAESIKFLESKDRNNQQQNQGYDPFQSSHHQ